MSETSIDQTLVREADHRARMALYLGVGSVLVVPLAVMALCLGYTTRSHASRGGAYSARVGRNFSLAALILWFSGPLLFLGLSAALVGAAATSRARGEDLPAPALASPRPAPTVEPSLPSPARESNWQAIVTARDVCDKLVAAGIVNACTTATPGGLTASATAGVNAELVSVPGKACVAWQFAGDAELASVEAAFSAMASLAGPHRYANKGARIFVQCNAGLSAPVGARVQAIVSAL